VWCLGSVIVVRLSGDGIGIWIWVELKEGERKIGKGENEMWRTWRCGVGLKIEGGETF
jgi:hypothetical protein